MKFDSAAEEKFLHGFSLFEQADYNNAVTTFSSLARHYPDEGLIYFWLGWTLNQLGEKKKAQEAMETGARLSFALPQNPYLVIANWLSVDSGDLKRSPWLQKAINWAVQSGQPFQIAKAHYELALLEKNRVLAKQYLEEALTYAPNDIDTLTAFSGILLDLENYDAARELLLQAKDKETASFETASFNLLYNLGRATMHLNMEEEAMSIYEEAVYGKGVFSVKRSNPFRWMAYWLSRYYLRKGRLRDLWKLSVWQMELEKELKTQRQSYIFQRLDGPDVHL